MLDESSRVIRDLLSYMIASLKHVPKNKISWVRVARDVHGSAKSAVVKLDERSVLLQQRVAELARFGNDLVVQDLKMSLNELSLYDARVIVAVQDVVGASSPRARLAKEWLPAWTKLEHAIVKVKELNEDELGYFRGNERAAKRVSDLFEELRVKFSLFF